MKVVIDGFSSGSIKVFFKVLLDKSKLPGASKEDPVEATRDVMLQEVMSLDNSQFQDITIDIDSILFSLSEVQDVAQKYLEPEPYQGSKEPSQTGSLWQNLGCLGNISGNILNLFLFQLNRQPDQQSPPWQPRSLFPTTRTWRELMKVLGSTVTTGRLLSMPTGGPCPDTRLT